MAAVPHNPNRDNKMSRALTKVLRHTAAEQGLIMRPDGTGYCRV
jgi:RNA:NAD 2'-phosphotransferase (TPT1/KptA family)